MVNQQWCVVWVLEIVGWEDILQVQRQGGQGPTSKVEFRCPGPDQDQDPRPGQSPGQGPAKGSKSNSRFKIQVPDPVSSLIPGPGPTMRRTDHIQIQAQGPVYKSRCRFRFGFNINGQWSLSISRVKGQFQWPDSQYSLRWQKHWTKLYYLPNWPRVSQSAILIRVTCRRGSYFCF